MATNTAEDRYLTIRELIDYSHLSYSTIARHLASETSPLPHYRVGGRVLIRRSEFDAWVAKIGTPTHVAKAKTVDDQVRDALTRFGRRRP
jgi:excisionase family DNA binding protein